MKEESDNNDESDDYNEGGYNAITPSKRQSAVDMAVQALSL